MVSLEMKSKYCKRKIEPWKEIEKIAKDNDVPNWKAQLYFYFKNETRKFLFFRDIRVRENYKNKIKEYLGVNSESQSTISINWKELYEILGKDATDKLFIEYIFETINYILWTIELLAENKIDTPYVFIKEVLNDCYMPKEMYPKIEESIKRYLLTELPTGSDISLELFTRVKKEPKKTKYVGSKGTYQFGYEENEKVNLYIKVNFSYCNPKD